MSARDGGAAFPVPYALNGQQAGMSLRDYFAAHAPFTMEDAGKVYMDGGGDTEAATVGDLVRVLVQLRMDYADDMVAARAGVDHQAGVDAIAAGVKP